MKHKFRQKYLSKLKSLPVTNRLKRDKAVSKKLLDSIYCSSAKDILLYWPLKIEPDIRGAINTLRRKGYNLYLPFMEGKSFKMVPFRYPMREKKYNIYESGSSNRKIKKIDLAVVPIIGIDNRMRRIGFGQGMYDRFFSKLQQKPDVIFVQSTPCISTLPLGNHQDVDAKQLITPFISYKATRIGNAVRNIDRRSCGSRS